MNRQAEEVYRLIGEGCSLNVIAFRLDVTPAAVREACRALHEELRGAAPDDPVDH